MVERLASVAGHEAQPLGADAHECLNAVYTKQLHDLSFHEVAFEDSEGRGELNDDSLLIIEKDPAIAALRKLLGRMPHP